MAKKRKLSGLNDTELSLAYDALTKLRASFQYEFVDEQVEDAESVNVDRLEEQLDGLLSLMKSRLEGPKVCIPVSRIIPAFTFWLVQTLSFSNVTFDILQDRLHVEQVGVIRLKVDLAKRIEIVSRLGRDHIWSSDNFQRHLAWLETVVPQTVCTKLST